MALVEGYMEGLNRLIYLYKTIKPAGGGIESVVCPQQINLLISLLNSHLYPRLHC